MANLLAKTHYMMVSNDLVFGQPNFKASEAIGTDVIVRIREDFSTEVELNLEDGRTKLFWFNKDGLLVGERKATSGSVVKEMVMSYDNGLDINANLRVTYVVGRSSRDNEVETPTIKWLLVDSLAVLGFVARARVINDPSVPNKIKQECKIFGQELLFGKGVSF